MTVFFGWLEPGRYSRPKEDLMGLELLAGLDDSTPVRAAAIEALSKRGFEVVGEAILGHERNRSNPLNIADRAARHEWTRRMRAARKAHARFCKMWDM